MVSVLLTSYFLNEHDIYKFYMPSDYWMTYFMAKDWYVLLEDKLGGITSILCRGIPSYPSKRYVQVENLWMLSLMEYKHRCQVRGLDLRTTQLVFADLGVGVR